MKRHRCLSALVLLTVAAAAACGDDSPEEPSSLDVAVSGDTISTSGSARAGAVEVTVTGVDPGVEVDFTRVEPGTSVDQALQALAVVIDGGPFADLILNNSGTVAGTSTILLEEGSYVVWADLGGGDDGSPEFVATALDVAGGGGADLPDTDGTITAKDYGFDIDVAAGDTFTFRNRGEQYHHAVLMNFGDLDPAMVRENFPAFVAAEDETAVPEAFAALDFGNLEAAASSVFGPGSGGTFAGTLEAGSTYVAVCFISDKSGGPPHAMAHGMFEVFTVT